MERETIECEAGIMYVFNSHAASMGPPRARARDREPWLHGGVRWKHSIVGRGESRT